jgi:mono/diheme cytochrome c family protein
VSAAVSPARAVLVLAAVTAGAAVAVFGGYTWLARDSAGFLAPQDASVVARGQAVYVAQCASCHGRNLEGQPDWQTRDKDGFLPAPPHDQSGHTWHHPDRLLFDITKRGLAEAANLNDYKTRMPAFGDVLADEDIVAVLSYIKSQWPEDVQQRHNELNRVYAKRNRQ